MPTPAHNAQVMERIMSLCPPEAIRVEGGIAAPLGFEAAGVASGIKRAGLDLALVVSWWPCQAAGVFTTNVICAAPVTLCRQLLARVDGDETAGRQCASPALGACVGKPPGARVRSTSSGSGLAPTPGAWGIPCGPGPAAAPSAAAEAMPQDRVTAHLKGTLLPRALDAPAGLAEADYPHRLVAPAAFHALVVNSGNANACNGEAGTEAATQMAAAVERTLDLPSGSAFVASTGVIGQPLPLDRALAGIVAAAANLSGGAPAPTTAATTAATPAGAPKGTLAAPEAASSAARAIMTTDTVPKEISIQVPLTDSDGVTRLVHIGAMSKGSGMIHPNMATMLGCITTDVSFLLGQDDLMGLLRELADASMNLIAVDNDTSTNDTLLLLANGAAGIALGPNSPGWAEYKAALLFVVRYLAILMAADGEGASKLLEVTVKGSFPRAALKKVALAVAQSYLVKTAIFGEDANWGRVICAAGYSGVAICPESIDIWVGDLLVCQAGTAVAFDETRAKEILSAAWVTVTISLDSRPGGESLTAWSCDLTHDYVDINGSYRS